MPTRPGTVFEDKLRVALRPYPAAARYLIGVSGGGDSVSLLHGLLAAGYRHLVVCHLDHGLRGEEARRDADFVRDLAQELGLRAEISQAEAGEFARQEKLSPEAAAREVRYRFFAEVATRLDCPTLFLAHQADDQIETFLFRLLRGAGPVGLSAMAVESERRVGACRLRIVRPLLAVWRKEVDDFLGALGLAWREDPTNADPAHSPRNALRHALVPALSKAMGRDVKPALWRAADVLAAEETWLAGLTAASGPLPARLPVHTLTEQPVAKQRRLIRAWLQDKEAPGIGYREIEAVRSLLDPAAGPAKVNLPGGWHARRRQGLLLLEQGPSPVGCAEEDRTTTST